VHFMFDDMRLAPRFANDEIKIKPTPLSVKGKADLRMTKSVWQNTGEGNNWVRAKFGSPINVVGEIADALLHFTPQLCRIPQLSRYHRRLQTTCNQPARDPTPTPMCQT
jgi:hypothetical protein